MTRRLVAVAALALSLAAAPSAQDHDVHTFQVRAGEVYLDGRVLPGAVPEGLDLSERDTAPLEFSGPITPVLEVKGQAYVLENGRLVLMSESSRADRGVYILGDASPDEMAEMPQEQMEPIVEEAYMRDVASRDVALFDRMQRGRLMERDVAALAGRVRAAAAGSERRSLRRQLRGLLSDLLALKHEIRAEEIAVATQRLDGAREALTYREGHHDEIVDGRLDELVGPEN